MADILCLGEALIDFVATESGVGVGEASGFVKAPGGAPANVAVGVARLGRSSAFLGKVGDDPFGRFLAETFAGAGVDVGGMVFSKEHRTGLAFVSLTDSGERDFCFFRNPSADMTYTPEEVDEERLLAAKIFHFGSITMIDEPACSATLAAMEMARKAGLLISYDPNLRPPLWPDLKTAKSNIRRTLHSADIIKLSEEELVFLLDDAPRVSSVPTTEKALRELVLEFLAIYPQVALLAVTRGANGCFWATQKGNDGLQKGLNVSVVDTTGAGDGFVAALLVGLLERNINLSTLASLDSETLKPLFTFANAVGALTTTRKGAIPALPTREETLRFLALQN